MTDLLAAPVPSSTGHREPAGRRSTPVRTGTPRQDPGGPVRPDELREVLRRQPSGVVVVTGKGPYGPFGATIESFTAVSATPPLVSFCIPATSANWFRLERTPHFAVNLLAADQADLAERFAAADGAGEPGSGPFAGVDWRVGPAGLPLLVGSTGHLLCRKRMATRLGDHVLVVGVVLQTTVAFAGSVHAPLVSHDGRYGTVG